MFMKALQRVMNENKTASQNVFFINLKKIDTIENRSLYFIIF